METGDMLEKANFLLQIRKIEKGIKQERKDRKAYPLEVIDMWKNYEEMVFWLSEHSKNETIESIKKMSIGQRLKFQELINNKLKQKQKNAKNG